MISKYFIKEFLTDEYLYHYTSEQSIRSILKYGLLSPYAMYNMKMPQYNGIMKRVGLKLGRKDVTFEDVEEFFEEKGLSAKDIFFSFWEIIPGMHKKRDLFIKKSVLIKFPLGGLHPNWTFKLIDKNTVKVIDKHTIRNWCNINSLSYQKMQGGKFLFSNLPHLAIGTEDGIISKEKLFWEN